MSSPYGGRFDGEQWPWTLEGGGFADWWALHDATGRYISDACVEGDTGEMRSLAAALRAGDQIHFKRCAAWIEDGAYRLCSPRNTVGDSAVLPLERAGELADIIDRTLDGAVKR